MTVLFILGIGTGCQSAQPLATEAPPTTTEQADAANNTTAPDMSEVEATLREAHAAWHGTPHRLGGTTPRGVDCSGFLYVLFPALFNTSLPRTTEAQARTGTSVRASRLQPGDLVFFRPSRKVRHVGVYLSDGEFLHVPNSGVRINRLDEPYWANAYWMARRVLSDPSVVASQPGNAVSEGPPRTGW